MKYEFLISNVILVISFIVLFYLIYKPGKYVKSSIDNKDYFVSDSVNPSSEEIANTLATIRKNINVLCDYLKSKHHKEYQDNIDELIKTVKDIDISENTKNIYTSYTINKNELVFCVKSKQTGQIHDMNLLMYVVLHELSHIACPEYGHTELFKKIFHYILTQAEECGIYKQINFYLNPQEYCGMNITSG